MTACFVQVVSDRANKSILVAIDRWRWIPKYKKEIKRTTKLMAHDEGNECRLGDLVQVELSRCVLQSKAYHACHLPPCAVCKSAMRGPKPCGRLLTSGMHILFLLASTGGPSLLQTCTHPACWVVMILQ